MTIQRTEADGVCTITLDRPEKLNALSLTALEALVDALDEASRTARVESDARSEPARGSENPWHHT